MTVGTNYSTPVNVNGFLCKNCTDVDYAKKHIDPAHPRSGPYGVDAKDDPTNKQTPTSASVILGGSLGGLNTKQQRSEPSGDTAPNPSATTSVGTQIDLSV